MSAKIINRTGKKFTVSIDFEFTDKMLLAEEFIQKSLNEAGALATEEVLSKFDADGAPIKVGSMKLTTKGQESKVYQTPYGSIHINRHVYQSSQGGETYCPLEVGARIITTSTPKFAKMVSFKYAENGSSVVERDLVENHGRGIARSYIKTLAEAVGSVVEAKEENWAYDIPPIDRPVKSVSIGLDGTCMLMCEEGWRETMVGTLAFYDKEGERLHTTYSAASPEYGKQTFLDRFEREIERAKEHFPKARFIGLADGAKGNWEFLKKYTEIQTIDFWHASQYLSKAATAMIRGKENAQLKANWLEDACHRLKHKEGIATRLLNEMINYRSTHKIPKSQKDDLNSAITYFKNNRSKMKYGQNYMGKRLD